VGRKRERQAHHLRDAQRHEVMRPQMRHAPQQQWIERQAERGVGRACDQEANLPATGKDGERAH